MIDIPKDVAKYLVRDEKVDSEFGLRKQTVFTSTIRLFIIKGKNVKDISYAHISSMELKSTPSWSGVIAGIVVIVGIFIMPTDASMLPDGLVGTGLGRIAVGVGLDGLGWFFILLGVILIVAGVMWKNHSITLSVAGMSKKQVLSGNKVNIDALFRLVNERRFQLSNAISDIKAN